MFTVKIYGEIISTYAKQQGYKGVSLEDVQNQLAKAEGQPIKVRINSVGGDVSEGFEIYNELRRYATDNKVKVHCFGEGMVASVATVIFLAGDIREITRNLEPFVHNAQYSADGDSRVFSDAAKDLERWNDRIAKHYADHTNLSYKEARILMDSDAYVTPEEALKMKFATRIEKVQRPTILAKYSSNNSNNNNQMTKQKKGFLAKLSKALGFSAKIVLDAEQREVDFYELEEDDIIEVGAKATIDGIDAEGDVVMANGEVYVFAGGELIEILDKEEVIEEEVEAVAETETIDGLKSEIETLKAQLTGVTAKYEKASAKAKQLSGVVTKFTSLESNSVETTTEAPKKVVTAKSEKGSKIAGAIESLLKTNNIK